MPVIIPRVEVKKFQSKILQWYAMNKRDLPWRRTRDPYAILVSEVMLQQTQVGRVIPKYAAWMKEWPTIAGLANAKTADVLRMWSGLGYNRRALYLQRCAQELIEKQVLRSKNQGDKNDSHNSEVIWPQAETELMQLPGIGKYTARALLCFAFDKQLAVVDTNIRKVILTQLGNDNCHCEERMIMRDEAIPRGAVNTHTGKGLLQPLHGFAMTEREIQDIADQLLPQENAYEWNQALMDYAAAELKKEKIPLVKQTKFIGSRRYYRGKILQMLLAREKATLSEIGACVKSDFVKQDEAWLLALLTELEKEGFISKIADSYAVANAS